MTPAIDALNRAGETFIGIAGPMLVQSSLLIVLLLLLDRLFGHRLAPSARYAVWMLVLLKLLLPPTLVSPTGIAYGLAPARVEQAAPVGTVATPAVVTPPRGSGAGVQGAQVPSARGTAPATTAPAPTATTALSRPPRVT